MKKRALVTPLTVFATLSLSAGYGWAQTDHDLAIDVIEVTVKKPQAASEDTLYSDAPLTTPIFDAGAILRSVTGMDAARRGGRVELPLQIEDSPLQDMLDKAGMKL